MSTDINSRVVGTPVTSDQGGSSAGIANTYSSPATYSMGLRTVAVDPAAASQSAAYADSGMTSVVNQFAGMGISPGLPAIPGYPGMPMAPNGGLYSPAMFGLAPNPAFSMMPDGNGPVMLHNTLKWTFNREPNVEDINTSNAFHPLNQYPKAYRDQMLKYWDNSATNQELPPLENRRSSYSTTESTPATPFYGSTVSRDGGARVAVFDHGTSSYHTPSPPQVTPSSLTAQPKDFSSIQVPVDGELKKLLAREPPIPQAVPAVFTPRENMKSLDQSLINPIPGNRNVYIRGLHPTTDDDLLYNYAGRFGSVETSKAIIDTATGACKGFGFAKFKTISESEACIRGFYTMGYEVGFARVREDAVHFGSALENPFQRYPKFMASADASASQSDEENDFLEHSGTFVPQTPRAVKTCTCPCELHSNMFTNFDPWDQESFNSRLKAEGDDNSTNLYISNLPKSISETDLGTIFDSYTILSAKILRDSLGNSRGVGFARFESREICDEVITCFTGQALGDEGLPMQIRYADTPAQKELKRITSERRQFRTNEYNVSAYGTPLVGMSPTIYSQPGWKQRGISNGSTPFPRSAFAHLKDADLGSSRLSSSNDTSIGSPPSENSSGDEDATIHVDTPLVANGSTHSSPVKKEKD